MSINLAITLFQHDTNRNQEPNAHFHAVVANVTQGPDGKWRALRNDKLWQHNTLLNAMTMARFRLDVEKLGYEVREFGKHGSFEAVGVPKAVRDAFSSRRAEILEAAAQMNFSGPGVLDAATLMTVFDLGECLQAFAGKVGRDNRRGHTAPTFDRRNNTLLKADCIARCQEVAVASAAPFQMTLTHELVDPVLDLGERGRQRKAKRRAIDLRAGEGCFPLAQMPDSRGNRMDCGDLLHAAVTHTCRYQRIAFAQSQPFGKGGCNGLLPYDVCFFRLPY